MTPARLNHDDPIVSFKLDILRSALPCRSAVFFGDIWRVDGSYTCQAIDEGCEHALLIDTLETPGWLQRRLTYPNVNFYKGDFADPLFMKSITEKFEVGVAFDVLLHQAPLLSTLNLMLNTVEKKFAVVQPMLKEQNFANSLIYLPGSSDRDILYPVHARNDDFNMFDVTKVNHSNWIWGMTPSFLRSAFQGEGFEIVVERTLMPFENDLWFWWGGVAERNRDSADHWSAHRKGRFLVDTGSPL